MTFLSHVLSTALSSLRLQARRLLPMALGIVWGMASVMALLGLAAGFEQSQRRALAAYGERFLLLRLNRAELDRAAGGEERRLRMDELDIERLRRGAPAIRRLSPVNMAYRAKVTGRSGSGSQVFIGGVLPEVTELRNLPLEEGRFFDAIDEDMRRRVIVLGPRVRKQLFGSGPALGQTVRIAGYSTSDVPLRPQPVPAHLASKREPVFSFLEPPAKRAESEPSVHRDVDIATELFEVVGVLKDVEVQQESYVSVARMAFVPFSTSRAVFDTDFSTIYIEPRSIEDHDLALRQFREVMGSRYGFDIDDRNAVVVYFDAIERARSIEFVFLAVRGFLAAVGAVILAVGALGVMNVVLVSLSARRYEIGLRKALGATPLGIALQFFVETALACLASGLCGFGAGAAAVKLLALVPLPQGFAEPTVDTRAALLGFSLLAVLAAATAVYPAYRAARLDPVRALSARG
jgi:putative ABC transport system permease protein